MTLRRLIQLGLAVVVILVLIYLMAISFPSIWQMGLPG